MAERAGLRSVRARLLVMAVLPMLVLTPVLLSITMQRWLVRTDQILTARVASDLTVGRQYLDHLQANTRQAVAAFGDSAAFRDTPPADRPARLREAQAAMELDFLLLIGPEEGPTALRSGESGLAVLSADTLAALSPGLAERARIPLRPTPGSPPPAGAAEERGLVILATHPLAHLPGMQLVGGLLLNRNDAFIDRINDLVYPATNPVLAGQVAPGFDLGITTLFLGPARISTTLRPPGEGRALGTLASAEVIAQVLERGQSWHDTAFVVNDWYVSAYEPLIDRDGARIGMLYAGIPLAPYARARQVTFLLIGAAFVVVAGLFVPLALHWARGIFRPVEAMGRTIADVEAGDLSARSGTLPGPEEITRLAAHLDQLLTRLEARDRDLRGLNEDLNSRVEARTADLRRAHHALEATTQQLVLAAKLATIGEVTAGVAHEINNPLAVISGNLEVVRMVLDDRLPEADTELRLIEDQIRRIAALVTRLLQFARPEEFSESGAGTDPASAIAGLRPLVAHLLAKNGVRLEEHVTATRPLRMSAPELQQVLVNLVANAVQAMPEGGTIRLTAEEDATGLHLSLRDTGIGMEEATLARIFDPFFTTRGREGGTGLGLPICQSLIARQGGRLSVTSTPGQGTTFHIHLPTAPV